MSTLFVTGGAGFIGSNFVEIALTAGHKVIVYDALTYAGHLENLSEFEGKPNFHFEKGLIQDQEKALQLFRKYQIDGVIHFAAESHVDKSIEGPKAFVDTNIMGTYSLLEASRSYLGQNEKLKDSFRFVHVSTDEVFGTLGETGYFTETTPYQPNSPYSASKAGSDLLARAWFHTFKVPVIITNCSNNYGPKQFPEKLIPHMILSALSEKPLPVYGNGANIRDWIYVKDHARGVLTAFEKGIVGESYCFGGRSERKNLDVVHQLCAILDELHPRKDGKSYREQITFVADRPGHDLRYAIDDSKAEKELGFTRTQKKFEDGLKETVRWYLSHMDWSKAVLSKPGAKVTYDWGKLS